MSNSLKRKINRKKFLKEEKEGNKILQNKMNNIFLPDSCSLCHKNLDKKSREMAMTWMVIAENEMKVLICPECWKERTEK